MVGNIDTDVKAKDININLFSNFLIFLKIKNKEKPSISPPSEEKTEHFNVSKSHIFYSKIAEDYDEANSKKMHNTHHAVIEKIEKIMRSKGDDPISVLDLGSGTGKLVAHDFRNNENLKWTNFDLCKEMSDEFEQNLSTAKFSRKSIKGDIMDIGKIDYFEQEKFDIIIICFVLSSMSKYPNFGSIKSFLKDDGSLLIADAYPSFTRAKPLYRVKNLTLKTKEIRPLKLVSSLMSKGFILQCCDIIKVNLTHEEKKEKITPEDYAFITEFKLRDFF